MNTTFWHQIKLIVIMFCLTAQLFAMPAPKKNITIKQPDGTEIFGRMVGDEFFRYVLSENNRILLPGSDGFYRYAEKNASGDLVAGSKIAGRYDKAVSQETAVLKFSDKQMQKGLNSRISQGLLRSSEVMKYPTTGVIKSIVILVNFPDLQFNTENAGTVFNDMLNKKGYKEGKHIGSVKDYYELNSSGKFSPDFVVVGPVMMDSSMVYYGQNDENQDDKHPAEMVYEACKKAASFVDFSQFDADNNGYVDNVYVFYAGRGEADGGGANAIWPHSWELAGENLSLRLNGKSINYYACSSELQGNGSLTGIGTFTHEFGHILGLVDAYDVDYEVNGEGFDIGEWSLMAHGGYNADGAVPPSLTLIERNMLGWCEPIELKDSPGSISLPPLDSSNTGYILKTKNEGEFYLFENRQQIKGSWDEYLYHHGMLVFHIDQRKNTTLKLTYSQKEYNWEPYRLWEMNLTNAISSHQCMDIMEADNAIVKYNGANLTNYIKSIKGDPFPGGSNKTSITRETLPTFLTWEGDLLNKPITNIRESGNNVLFDYMGGSDFNLRKPVVKPASNIGSFSFSANWELMYGADFYKIELYQISISGVSDTLRTLINEYICYDTVSFKISDLEDQTNYEYRVTASNGIIYSQYSDFEKFSTPDAEKVIAYVTNKRVFLKGIDKDTEVKIYNPYRLVKKTKTASDGIELYSTGIYFAEVFLKGKIVTLKFLIK